MTNASYLLDLEVKCDDCQRRIAVHSLTSRGLVHCPSGRKSPNLGAPEAEQILLAIGQTPTKSIQDRARSELERRRLADRDAEELGQ